MHRNPQYIASDGSRWILVIQGDWWNAALVDAGDVVVEPVEIEGDTQAELEEKIEAMVNAIEKHGPAGHRRNPDNPPQFNAARETFEGFHDFEMRGSGKFKREIIVPERMALAGPCRFVTYSSDKWSDGTHEYIHTITSFPKVKAAVTGEDTGRTVAVPKRVRQAVTVSLIGRALGFAVEKPDGDEVEATFPASSEWYWSPTGKALYCVQGRSKLLAVVWGGRLDVEPRGIVG